MYIIQQLQLQSRLKCKTSIHKQTYMNLSIAIQSSNNTLMSNGFRYARFWRSNICSITFVTIKITSYKKETITCHFIINYYYNPKSKKNKLHRKLTIEYKQHKVRIFKHILKLQLNLILSVKTIYNIKLCNSNPNKGNISSISSK